jgi:putative lipoprotein
MKYKSRFVVLVWTTVGMMISVSPNYAQTQPKNIAICTGTANTIRIDDNDAEMVMTAFYQKDNVTWLNTAAQAKSTDTGINYSNLRGEQTVNLFVPHNQEFCEITIGDQATELGSLTTQNMNNTEITGTITYRERIALPPDAVIKIKLLDVSRQDTAAIEIASQSLTTTGEQVPISFALPYDASKIQEQQTYVVRAEIYLNDQLSFTTTQIYPVITRGHSNEVNLVLSKISPSTIEIQGSKWLLEDLAGKGVVDGVQTTLEFGEDNRLGGNGGCNVYFTGYELDGSNLKVGPIGSTQMMCPPALMDQERKFLQALEKAYNLRIEGPYLFIDSQGHDLPLKFTRS